MAVAIVTGGASGIGRATVGRLARDGWTVVSWDIASADAPESAAREMLVDVTDRSSVAAATATIVGEAGTIDLLVNSAGSTRRGPTEDMSWEDWSAIIDLNLHGTFNCMQAVGRIMLDAGKGAMVNVASIAAERGGVGRAPYCVSKAGVAALTRVAGVEWAQRGVRVNAVGPGWTKTPLFATTALAPGILEKIVGLIPTRRLAEPDEIAGVIAFLASPDASFITAQLIYVDGGYTADFHVGLA